MQIIKKKSFHAAERTEKYKFLTCNVEAGIEIDKLCLWNVKIETKILKLKIFFWLKVKKKTCYKTERFRLLVITLSS